MNIRKNLTGFTLIELLVVIAIIGILSSFGVVSVNDARIKARDAKRQADLAQVQTALQIYLDKNATYPPCSCTRSDCWDEVLSPALLNEAGKPYIFPIPVDPTDTGVYYYDYCSDDGTEFFLTYQLEQSEVPTEIRGF